MIHTKLSPFFATFPHFHALLSTQTEGQKMGQALERDCSEVAIAVEKLNRDRNLLSIIWPLINAYLVNTY